MAPVAAVREGPATPTAVKKARPSSAKPRPGSEARRGAVVGADDVHLEARAVDETIISQSVLLQLDADEREL